MGKRVHAMEPMPGNSAVAVRCEPNGALKEVIYDKFGLQSRLTSGGEFAAIIAPIHLRRASRFLETLRKTGSAQDWELHVNLREGVTPLFFSGWLTGLGVIIVGAAERLADAAHRRSARHAGPNLDKPAAALKRRTDRASAADTRAERQPRRAGALANGAAHRGNETEGSLLWLEIATHDLRNPVSGVLAAAQFLIEDAGRILQAHHLTLLRSIEASSQFMLRILQDLSDIPALESSKTQFDFYLTDAGALVENAVSANRPLADAKRISLEVRIDKPASTVFADPFRIGHALKTLLAHAIRCSPADSWIEIEVATRKDFAVIAFRGEDPDKLAHDLKAVFHSSDNLRPKSGLSEERAALTLRLAKQIVAAHRGTIQLGNGAIRGAALTLSLPISEGAPRSAKARKTVRKIAHASSPQ
jgi:signal transduction histidine kinase